MEVAIKFERIDLDGLKILFKPVSVIKGKLDREENLFETDYGLFCDPINTSDFDAIDYYGYCMSMDKLKELYKSENEEEILFKYFQECNRFFYIGYFDYEKEITNVVSLPFSQVVEQFIKIEEQEQNSDEVEISLDEETLRQLEKMEDISQIKDFINKILLSIDNIKQQDGKVEIIESNEQKESDKQNYKIAKEESKKMISLKELREDIKASIIGQDKAVDDITRQIMINMTSKNYRNKSHIFITGPSGTGKTEIINLIAKRFGLPVFKANATEYSKSGYIGKETNSMLAGLISAAGGDVKKAEQGFLIIDEMDKVVLGSSNNKNFDKAIIFALLKMMDRDVVEVDIDHYNSVLFDTSNLNIIFMGAFSEYLKEKKKYEQKPMGFNAKSEKEHKMGRITQEDLIKIFGAEFVGRLGRIASTDELSLENVIKILYDSKISQYKVTKEDLLDRGVELESDEEFIIEVAKQGYSEETGVRNLNKVVKEKFDYIYDEILINGNVKTLKLTKETALDPRKYYAE